MQTEQNVTQKITAQDLDDTENNNSHFVFIKNLML